MNMSIPRTRGDQRRIGQIRQSLSHTTTASAVARRAECTRQCVNLAIKTGALPTIGKVGHMHLIYEPDAARWIAEMKARA